MKRSSGQNNFVTNFLGHNKGFVCIIFGEVEKACPQKTGELTLANVQL